MLTETYLEGKFIKEREIDLSILSDRLNNFIGDGAFTQAKVCLISPVDKGVSYTFTNRVKIDNFKLRTYNDCLLIEFEEFKNVISVNEYANVCLDLMNSRVLLKDFGISIYFS